MCAYVCVVPTTTMHLARLTEGRICVGAAGLITNLNLRDKFCNFFKLSFSAVIKKIFLYWRTSVFCYSVHNLSSVLCTLIHSNRIYFPMHCHPKILPLGGLWYMGTCIEGKVTRCLTFRGPCIIIYILIIKPNRCTISQIYFGIEFCMFRTGLLSIIRTELQFHPDLPSRQST